MVSMVLLGKFYNTFYIVLTIDLLYVYKKQFSEDYFCIWRSNSRTYGDFLAFPATPRSMIIISIIELQLVIMFQYNILAMYEDVDIVY